MSIIELNNDQKAQLVGWLNRENDFLLSMKAMGERCVVPGATGTLELVRNDYEWVQRVRKAVKMTPTSTCQGVDLSEQDIETLVDIARANRYADRDSFWTGIVRSCGGPDLKIRDHL